MHLSQAFFFHQEIESLVPYIALVGGLSDCSQLIPSTQYIPPPTHHYSLHSLDLSMLIHDWALLAYHIVVAVAAAENVLEISIEGGTAVVVQQSQVVVLLHLFLPSLIENPCNS